MSLPHTWRRRRRARTTAPAATKATTVFLLSGRNVAVTDRVAAVLESFGLNVVRWGEAIAAVQEAPAHAGAVADYALERGQAIVALVTGDTVSALHRSLTAAAGDEEGDLALEPTPEFLLELGKALGRMSGPDEGRLIPVRMGPARMPAEIGERGITDLDGGPSAIHELVLRLREAGCRIATGAGSKVSGEEPLRPPVLALPAIVEEGTGTILSAREAAFFRLGSISAPPLPGGIRPPGLGGASNPVEALVLVVRELGLEASVSALIKSAARLDVELRLDPNATSDARQVADFFGRAEKDVTAAVRETAKERELWAFRLGGFVSLVLRHAAPEPGAHDPRLEAALHVLDDHLAATPLSSALARLGRRFVRLAARGATRETLALEAEAIEREIALAAG